MNKALTLISRKGTTFHAYIQLKYSTLITDLFTLFKNQDLFQHMYAVTVAQNTETTNYSVLVTQ